MSWHNPNFRPTIFPWRDDAWAVRSNQSNSRTILDESNCFDHVKCWYSFSDAYDDTFALDLIESISCFHNRFTGKWRRNIDDGCIRIGRFNCFKHGIPYREVFSLQFNRLTSFTRRASPNNVGSIFDHFIRMEHPLLSSNSLHQELCVFFNPYPHQTSPPINSTIF